MIPHGSRSFEFGQSNQSSLRSHALRRPDGFVGCEKDQLRYWAVLRSPSSEPRHTSRSSASSIQRSCVRSSKRCSLDSAERKSHTRNQPPAAARCSQNPFIIHELFISTIAIDFLSIALYVTVEACHEQMLVSPTKVRPNYCLRLGLSPKSLRLDVPRDVRQE